MDENEIQLDTEHLISHIVQFLPTGHTFNLMMA